MTWPARSGPLNLPLVSYTGMVGAKRSAIMVTGPPAEP